MSDSKSTEELREGIETAIHARFGGDFKAVAELLNQIDTLVANRTEEAHSRHRSTLRIIEQFIDRIPEMYAKELLHRMRAFDVEISNKEVDKEKLDEFLDKTFATLNTKTKEEK